MDGYLFYNLHTLCCRIRFNVFIVTRVMKNAGTINYYYYTMKEWGSPFYHFAPAANKILITETYNSGIQNNMYYNPVIKETYSHLRNGNTEL